MSKKNLFFKHKLTSLTLSLITAIVTFSDKNIITKNPRLKAIAADNIFFVYTPVMLPLKVNSLSEFAKKGTVDQNLGKYFYLANVGEEEKAKFREILTKPVQVDPVLLHRILNTEEAERLLNYFGSVITIKGGSNGKYLLRGALIQAAMEEDGLTLLNILEKLAVDIQIDIERILKYSDQVELVINGSSLFNEEVTRLEELEIKKTNKLDRVDFSRLPDIRQAGNISVGHQTLNLYDASRERKFYVELYYPQKLTNEKIPVVILSHGLASRPEDFAKKAIHLSSYGFVVAMPQHPGSDVIQAQDFLEGYSHQIFYTDEFTDRPADISYTLDELEKLNQTQFAGKLDLNNVGIFGHSFGGYTALAVSGATINFERLERNCNLDIGNLNTALLLQCRALNLPRKDYQFKDERIKAVFAINPVNAAVLGVETLSNITVPTFLGAGSYDPATPFIFEQAQTYPFLNGSETYLQLQEGQAHVDFSELDGGISNVVNAATNITLPSPTLLDDYTNSMMLAFFETYINQNPQYKVYLQSAYAQYLSKNEEFKMHLITKQSAPLLKESFMQFIQDNRKLIYN